MHLGKDSKLRVNVGRIVQLQKVRPVRWETTGNVRNTYAKVDVKIIQSLQIFMLCEGLNEVPSKTMVD